MANPLDTKINYVDLSLLNINNNNANMEIEYYAYTSQLINSCALPMVIKATIKMGVLQLIHDHASPIGLSPTEITTHFNILNPDAPSMLDRMLRLLATYSVVRCNTVSTATADGGVERRYSSSPVTELLVPNDDGVSLAPLVSLMNDKVFLESWTKLDKAVMEGGIPFNMVHGMHAYEYPNVDPSFNEVFNNAMYQTTKMIMAKILDKYKGLEKENIQHLVDVGGGLGHCLAAITSKYPSIKGTNFDLVHVIQKALPCTGVEHVSGDMFESVPRGDAILLKSIIHNWSDEHCLKLLKNCYDALPENGKVIVVDLVTPDEVENTNYSRVISVIDLTMMVQHSGGKERSKQEFEALAKAAGYSNVIFEFVYIYWVMEFHK